MTRDEQRIDATIQTLAVYPAADLRVVDGVAFSEALGFGDELMMEDAYQFASEASAVPLSFSAHPQGDLFCIAPGSSSGIAGNQLHIDTCITLMAPEGKTVELLIFVELQDGGVENVYFLPLGPLASLIDYRLVGIDQAAAPQRFADLSCIAFLEGTHITLASGQQVPIEALEIGDRVMTRGHGPQPIRWIGATKLCSDATDPVITIEKGALHNVNDLRIGPDHRLFIYQRQDTLGAGRREVLVTVRDLINDTTVRADPPNIADYIQLLFDTHQIIYAEGIAAEAPLIDPRMRSTDQNGRASTTSAQRSTSGPDSALDKTILRRPDAIDLLRKASSSNR